MTALIVGSNGSGKSRYAERLIARLGGSERYYVATMIPYGEDGVMRVDRHRKQRASLGFVTVERPYDVSGLLFGGKADVLLEDVSNLLANAMFNELHGDCCSVYGDIKKLCAKCRNTVIVSISGLRLGEAAGDDTPTLNYIAELNRLNDMLSVMADIVIQMKNSQPFCIKGKPPL